MAEQRQTSDALLGVDINADANIRDTSTGLVTLDINAGANARATEIVFLGITQRHFREMITPLTGHDEGAPDE